ncbi:UNVERIFIED_CONTAM: hypothetical protein Sangu_0240900 [Sesamum angustifolium]|uniref:Lysine ketoglutarate reductase trans-splicing protein n=1 Tax=Sesamum angustifolium TaxID=2727405 RepID=A0AAW2RQX3_9LAMI
MVNLPSSIFSSVDLTHIEDKYSSLPNQALLDVWSSIKGHKGTSYKFNNAKIWVPTNPRGAERLPPGIIVGESDLYIRRMWSFPSKDVINKPRYLFTFTVGYDQKENIDAAVRKLTGNFTVMLFHYDGRVSEWEEFEWSKRAIHVSARKQAKWWYAKRFLHPDIVVPYDYIFIWDEDLGVQNFDPEESTEERPGWCTDPRLPPCAAFVEIMAPVFSRDAWRCVWHLIQNDLVHGWGLDFALRMCVEPAHEKIGVVDSQWIVHQTVPSLGNQGEAVEGRAPWEGVRERCRNEWAMFHDRLAIAERRHYAGLGFYQPNATAS